MPQKHRFIICIGIILFFCFTLFRCNNSETENGLINFLKLKHKCDSEWGFGSNIWFIPDKRYNCYMTYNGKPFSGKVISKYPNGDTEFTGEYENGMETGFWTYYYKNKQVKEVILKPYNKYMGNPSYQKRFWENGELLSQHIWFIDSLENIFEKKRQDGATYHFQNDTILFEKDSLTLKTLKINYYKKVTDEYGNFSIKKTGNWVEYFPNGQLKKSVNYVDGEIEGLYLEYYENGKIKTQENYKNGYVEGEKIQYYPNGVAHIVGAYVHSRKSGLWSTYDSLGQLIEQVRFENGFRKY